MLKSISAMGSHTQADYSAEEAQALMEGIFDLGYAKASIEELRCRISRSARRPILTSSSPRRAGRPLLRPVCAPRAPSRPSASSTPSRMTSDMAYGVVCPTMTVERSQGNAAGHVRKVPEDATLTDDEGVLAVLVVRGPEARLQRVLRAVAGGGGRAAPPPPPLGGVGFGGVPYVLGRTRYRGRRGACGWV